MPVILINKSYTKFIKYSTNNWNLLGIILNINTYLKKIYKLKNKKLKKKIKFVKLLFKYIK